MDFTVPETFRHCNCECPEWQDSGTKRYLQAIGMIVWSTGYIVRLKPSLLTEWVVLYCTLLVKAMKKMVKKIIVWRMTLGSVLIGLFCLEDEGIVRLYRISPPSIKNGLLCLCSQSHSANFNLPG